MVVVAHEMGFANEVADRVIFVDDGGLLEQAPPKEFFSKPQFERTRGLLDKVQNPNAG
jgi:ABC-type polar amino acid transport system ATPase subunit